MNEDKMQAFWHLFRSGSRMAFFVLNGPLAVEEPASIGWIFKMIKDWAAFHFLALERFFSSSF
jgi:hypothetical protein